MIAEINSQEQKWKKSIKCKELKWNDKKKNLKTEIKSNNPGDSRHLDEEICRMHRQIIDKQK